GGEARRDAGAAHPARRAWRARLLARRRARHPLLGSARPRRRCAYADATAESVARRLQPEAARALAPSGKPQRYARRARVAALRAGGEEKAHADYGAGPRAVQRLGPR